MDRPCVLMLTLAHQGHRRSIIPAGESPMGATLINLRTIKISSIDHMLIPACF
jgi:hypothetical protein